MPTKVFGVRGIVVFVDDGGRVVGHAGDERDVGARQGQGDGGVVDDRDRAFDRLVGVGVDDRGEAAGHRVRLDLLVAPALDVAGDVLGGEGIAVVPGHALADLEGVEGRVVVHLPAVQQHPAERAVVVVLDEVFERAAGDVGDLGPVGGAGVLEGLDLHLAAERAARLHVRFGKRGPRGTDQAVGGRRRYAERGRAGKEFAAAQAALAKFVGIHERGRMNGSARVGFFYHRCLLPVGRARSESDLCMTCWAHFGMSGPSGQP